MTETEIANAILQIIDQLTLLEEDGPILSLVARMREFMDGNTPSMVLKQVVLNGAQQALEQLRAQNNDLLLKVNAQPIINEKGEPYYTFGQFLAALHIKMGRTYAWRTDYLSASASSPSCRAAKNEHIQQWQRTNLVPAWAYEQIDQLQFDKRQGNSGPQWSQSDYDFLIKKYLEDPTRSNAELAAICSEHHGRPISEDSIKGAVDRLRKKSKIPKLRPKK